MFSSSRPHCGHSALGDKQASCDSPLVATSPSSIPSTLCDSPRIQMVDLDTSPFSESFSGIVNFGDDVTCGLGLGVGSSKSTHRTPALTNLEMSYDLERFTNSKELWDDNEIDEIVVMSPKARLPNIQEENESHSSVLSLSDFQLLNPLDSGNVILGRKRDDNNLYTLKVLPVTGSGILKQSRSEVTCMKIVNNLKCASISRMHWSFEDRDHLYMVMDFYPGDLSSLLAREKVLGPDNSLLYASKIGEGIAILHAAGVIHRDLQPNHIKINSNGHPVITGFGFARIPGRSENHLFPVSLQAETKKYQAPELLLGWSHGFSVDCWTFGLLLHLMLYGTHPFLDKDGVTDEAALHRALLSGSTSLDTSQQERVDPAAYDLILKCLERNPAIRLDIRGIMTHNYINAFRRTTNTLKIGIPRSNTVLFNSRASFSASGSPILDTFASRRAPHGLKTSNMTWDSLSNDDANVVLPVNDSSTPAAKGIVDRPVPAQVSFDLTKLASEGVCVSPNMKDKSNLHGCGSTATAEQFKTVESPDEVARRQQVARDSFWETLTLDSGSLSSDRSVTFMDALDFTPPQPQPRKLRKQPSFIAPQRVLSAITDSSANVQTKLRKTLRRVSMPTLSSRFSRPVDLPSGIEQIGGGIGFTYGLSTAARSKASICTTTPRSCHPVFLGGLPMLNIGLGIRKTRGQPGRDHVNRIPEALNEDSEVVDVTRENCGKSWSRDTMTENPSHLTVTTAMNSPMSDGPATPDTAIFPGILEAKKGDPNSTLRLVPPPGLHIDEIRRDLGLVPLDTHTLRPL